MGEVEKKAEDAKNFISRFIGDVSKSSATKQIILGASSGWVTGFLAMRVGKSAALALGGGIILLQIANEKGYINVNWDKVNKKIDKVVDKVEEQITGEGPSWMDKAERFVDRKINQAEDKLKKNQKKAKNWFSRFSGEECKLQDVHIFIMSFAAGIAIGIGSA
ncbi:FUN14 domain-containing protein 1-like isoform X1 [Rhynchophorus ferrugineus]|uniref:FUN14 domain-containing protein 1-like isoform X1 n=1 Tax=Rhynchophorus ferrugineus TaxID=354439 RepID=UPI003FCE0540